MDVDGGGDAAVGMAEFQRQPMLLGQPSVAIETPRPQDEAVVVQQVVRSVEEHDLADPMLVGLVALDGFDAQGSGGVFDDFPEVVEAFGVGETFGPQQNFELAELNPIQGRAGSGGAEVNGRRATHGKASLY